MLATSAPHWKMNPPVCPTDPLALSPSQASISQSQGWRGEESAENQHLIGDGLTDWMTEKVDFSSYLPPSHSSPSPNPSLPPSPPQHDVQVPSDLEVMTSLLQEELAQLEDYFLSESESEKAEKLEKSDKASLLASPQSYYHLPYTPYNSGQSESSPLLVTLATGELDLLSFCGGPVGRPKTPRPVPYNCSRPGSHSSRKRSSDSGRVDEGLENSIWSCKRNLSGSPEVAVSYCFIGDNKVGGEEYCLGSAVEVRESTILLKEEENYCFTEDVTDGDKVVGGFCLGGSLEATHKKEGQLLYGLKEVSGSEDGMEVEVQHRGRAGELVEVEDKPCFLEVTATAEAYSSFLERPDESLRAGGLEAGEQHHGFCFPGFLGEESRECVPGGDGDGVEGGSPSHRADREEQEEPCHIKPEPDTAPEAPTGERKQKKRDQNKTAAHRYRQRKRAELDCLEEELRGLEGKNRELRDKAESVEREIQYVKDLLIEVYKARSQRLKHEPSA
ncbi:uncharacterized protein atf5a [Amia ocellicauda]|uniref:uncharacterized protein atf5a n=1 Tax=Amia ocellicauda TaxID=2972642 RepID=UPI00346463D7|nr:ATF5 factor [Amia calva]